MLDIDFVAAVLEGIEGTLEELIGRVGRSDLCGRLTTLQDETAAADVIRSAAGARATVNRPAYLKAHGEYHPRRSSSAPAPARLR